MTIDLTAIPGPRITPVAEAAPEVATEPLVAPPETGTQSPSDATVTVDPPETVAEAVAATLPPVVDTAVDKVEPEIESPLVTEPEPEPIPLVPAVIAPPATPENPIPGPVAIVPVAETLPVPVKATATQVAHPARAVVRTIFAVVLGLVTLTPDLVSNAHLGNTALGAQALVVAGFVTRALASPVVEQFLSKWVPWLSAQPSS